MAVAKEMLTILSQKKSVNKHVKVKYLHVHHTPLFRLS